MEDRSVFPRLEPSIPTAVRPDHFSTMRFALSADKNDQGVALVQFNTSSMGVLMGCSTFL